MADLSLYCDAAYRDCKAIKNNKGEVLVWICAGGVDMRGAVKNLPGRVALIASESNASGSGSACVAIGLEPDEVDGMINALSDALTAARALEAERAKS